MTLAAHKHLYDNDVVIVTANNGAIEVSVTENIAHVRSFWSLLGSLLNELENPKEG